MQSIQDTISLSNGVSMPCVGYGTWKTPLANTFSAVSAALHAGYRHIDTAAAYHNESAVGQAIAASGIPRAQIFLTSKLWNADQGYEAAHAAFARSLQALQTDYLDLYLIHWPHDPKFFDDWRTQNRESWRALEELYEAGKVRAIGVSNFRPFHLENLLQNAKIAPMVNQIEFHPGMPQTETTAFCRAHHIVIEGWSPLGSGRVFESPQMQALAARYQRSIAQICLRWSIQHDVVPLPKSTNPARIAENAAIFDFSITPADMELLDGLTECGWSGLDPLDLRY